MSPLYASTHGSLRMITRSRISGSKYSNCLENCPPVLPIDWLIDLFSEWPPPAEHGLWSEKYLASYTGSNYYRLCDLWQSSNLPEPAFWNPFDNWMTWLRERTQRCVWHIRFLSNIDSFSIISFIFMFPDPWDSLSCSPSVRQALQHHLSLPVLCSKFQFLPC